MLGLLSTELLKRDEAAILLLWFYDGSFMCLKRLLTMLFSTSWPSMNIYPIYLPYGLLNVPFLLTFPKESRENRAFPRAAEVGESSITSMNIWESLLEDPPLSW